MGNLYFNRKCTGAMVGAHPFGGFNMSGTDSKAGGPDYLLLFTQAKSVAEKLVAACRSECHFEPCFYTAAPSKARQERCIMPKIVRFHQLGGPESSQFEETQSTTAGQGRSRLRVQALGLNRAESLFYHGTVLGAADLPSRLGYEVAGVVESGG